MMQRHIPEQAEVPYTGTFVAVGTGFYDSVEELQAGPWVDAVQTGTMGYIGGAFLNRPPLAWGGLSTVSMTYSANLAANVWEGISGLWCEFQALEQRDYVVMMTVMWWGTSANWNYEHFTIDYGLGASTGCYPPEYGIQQDANADTSWVRLHTMNFVLPDLAPGNYRVQAYHSPWGSSLDRAISATSFIAVL